jgi:hypothetical protein
MANRSQSLPLSSTYGGPLGAPPLCLNALVTRELGDRAMGTSNGDRRGCLASVAPGHRTGVALGPGEGREANLKYLMVCAPRE